MKVHLATAFALVLLAAASPGQTDSAARPLWGDQEPGPHTVGFASWFELDASRPYQMTFANGQRYAETPAPRPILINLWYPAAEGEGEDAERMPHGEYLELTAKDEQVARFAAALAAYERDTIITELFRTGERALREPQRDQLARLLATRTACVRDAEPGEQRFPLVIYHAGYGSSFEDNAVLCEYLASHGYVVAGSAFQAADGKSFNIDAHEGTALDVDRMIAALRTRADVDAARVAMAGHSGGAHASLRQQARERSELAAVVSLDTTQDYYSNLDPRWAYVTEPLLAHPERMAVPMLFCAAPNACFQLADTLVHADRWYLTVPLGHNEFIAQGVIRAELASQGTAAGAEAAREAPRVRADYTTLCRSVRDFLDARLKGDAAAGERLAGRGRDAPEGTGVRVEVVPKGTSAPAPYVAGAASSDPTPPTPRQLRPLLATSGADAAVAILRRCHAQRPRAPAYDPTVGFALVYELAARGQDENAKKIGAYYRELDPGLLRLFRLLGDRYASSMREFAARCFGALVLLDPDDAEARRRLAELTGAQR